MHRLLIGYVALTYMPSLGHYTPICTMSFTLARLPAKLTMFHSRSRSRVGSGPCQHLVIATRSIAVYSPHSGFPHTVT